MRPSRHARALVVALACAGLAGCATTATVPPIATVAAAPPAVSPASLSADLDRIVDDPVLDGALLAVRIESLDDGAVIYSKSASARVVPASTMKIVTAAVAGERLGWPHRFDTRLEATGPIVDGVLEGDLVVVGTGDPTINAQDLISAPVFDQWADVLRQAGVRQIDGRLVGDDNAFDDEPLGAGWAWDYLTATYAAPSGALSYNENLVAVRISPGPVPGAPAIVRIDPPGHGLAVSNQVTTAPAGATAAVALERLPGSRTLTLRGQLPVGAGDVVRATTVVNPTAFFVEGFRLALASHGINVRDGAVDVDDLPEERPLRAERRLLATHVSPPLSAIVAQMMKLSQNFYGEMLIKAIGQTVSGADGTGSTERGRQAVRQTLDAWGIASEALVMSDGSGLSRYNYVSASLLVNVLRHMWADEQHRGPYVAALPVAGYDGTLGARMTDTLRRRVQAKTGTISNVRSLAGYAEAADGRKIVFAMVANHFIASNAAIDAVMEKVLEKVLQAQ